jgi:uncharacterized protein (DUF1499 family)
MASTPFPSLRPALWPARLTRAALWLVGVGLVLALVSGPLNRFGLTGFQPALLALALGGLLVFLGVLLGLVGFFGGLAKGAAIPRGLALLGLFVGLAVLGYLLLWLRQAMGVPPIHEVSTDLENPPAFVAVREIRERTPGVNPSDYVPQIQGRGGPIDVRTKQREAYPDLQPLLLDVPPGTAFARVESAASSLGWEVVASVPAEGRFEATDSTRFFGFKDDVVVRVLPTEGGSRVDVRSKSRVGLGDAGANAERVRRFLALVAQG